MVGPPPGLGQFLRGQLFQTPPLPTGNLAGQTIIVTGANSGLGLDACKHLVRLGVSRLILACRNVPKGEAAKKEILLSSSSSSSSSSSPSTTSSSSARTTPTKENAIEVWALDLSSYASVVSFAERCSKNLDRLDAVIENAGISTTAYRLAEENESTITVNVVSTFLLALLLLPQLRNSATRFNTTSHLSIVGSAVHFWTPFEERNAPPGKIFQTINDKDTAKMAERYFLSKLFVMLCVRELAERITANAADLGSAKVFVVVNNVAPGFCKTELFREDYGLGPKIGLGLIGRSSEEGSRTLVHGAMAGKESHGQYLSECRVKRASPFVMSKEGSEAQKRIWEELMDKLVKIKPGIQDNV